jgi:1-acyl-sn-glycerol-3-phosphate acyltransferase
MTFPLPPLTRYRVMRNGVGWSTGWPGCGRHHLPRRGSGKSAAEPAVILSKHQSAWETIVFQQIFPPLSFVLKKNLLYIPFFGWGLACSVPSRSTAPLAARR